MAFFVHPSAVIDDPCTIGDGSKIWHFCHLMSGSSIGSNCILGHNVFLGKNVVLGNGVKIQNNVSLFSGVVCEDDVFVGPSVVFTNVINPRAFVERKNEFKKTFVGKGATIGANTTVICGLKIGRFALVGAASLITKNVPNFALLYGSPATVKGWVSKSGHKLEFDRNRESQCPETGEKYKISEDEKEVSLVG